MDCLSNEQVINRIVNFETETFMEDQKGVDAATNNLTTILNHLSENSCQIKKLSSTKIRKPRRVMVRSISSRLKTSNQFIGKKYWSKTMILLMKVYTFSLIKKMKKLIKQKKGKSKQKIFKNLETA